jgi:hypothetical protein
MYMCVYYIAIAFSCDISIVSGKCCDSVCDFFIVVFISFVFHCVYSYPNFVHIHLGTINFTLYGWIYVLFFPEPDIVVCFHIKQKADNLCVEHGKSIPNFRVENSRDRLFMICICLLSQLSPLPKKNIAPITVTSSSSSYIRSC